MGVVTINHTHSQNLSSNPVLNDTRTVSVSQLNEIQSSGVYHVKARATSMRLSR